MAGKDVCVKQPMPGASQLSQQTLQHGFSYTYLTGFGFGEDKSDHSDWLSPGLGQHRFGTRHDETKNHLIDETYMDGGIRIRQGGPESGGDRLREIIKEWLSRQ